MTLGDIIPSIRSSLPSAQLDPEIWPVTARHGRSGLAIGGVPLMEVEQEFGTPAYVLDEEDVRERGPLGTQTPPLPATGHAARAPRAARA